MTELCKEKFDHICRLCSCPLTDTKHEICGKLGLSNIIEECLQIKVHKDDNLPQNLCDKCLALLHNLSAFRTSCYDIQTKLIACVKLNGESTDEVKTELCIKSEQPDAVEQESAGEPQSTISSDTDDVEIKENGLEKLPELSEPGSDDYVLMKEETFSLDANRENRTLPGLLSDNLVEFNNNSMNNNNNNLNNSSLSDKDLIDGQRLRNDILPPMWDVFEKIWPRSDSSNGEKTSIRVVHRRYVVSKLAFPCSLCGECFKFDQGYERGGTPEIRPYDCNTCGKVFPKRSAWKRHQATHENIKPFQCRVCGKGFNQKEHLTRHLLLHGSGKSFTCEKCHKVFSRNEHLTRHLQNSPSCWDGKGEQPGARPYSCQTCGQSFIRKEHLTRHMKRVHDIDPPEGEAEPRPFGCPTCSKMFTRREHLRRHQLIHQKEMTMECQQAEEVQCSPQIDAVPHMSEDNPTPSPPNSPDERKLEEQRVKKPTVVTCHICSKGFSRRSHLSRHLRQVHKVCPEGSSEEIHRCHECGKDFGRKYHLDRHAKIHLNTTYECVTCGEKFTESEALDKHMTVHGNTVLENFLWM